MRACVKRSGPDENTWYAIKVRGQQPHDSARLHEAASAITRMHCVCGRARVAQILEKASIVRRQSYEEVMREMVLLRDLRHPFICNVNYAFQASIVRVA